MKKRNNVFKFKGDSKYIIQFDMMNHCIIRKYPQPWKMTEDLALDFGHAITVLLGFCKVHKFCEFRALDQFVKLI